MRKKKFPYLLICATLKVPDKNKFARMGAVVSWCPPRAPVMRRKKGFNPELPQLYLKCFSRCPKQPPADQEVQVWT